MIERPYYDLPYLDNISLPKCDYGKAAAIRVPISDAVNSARAMPAHKMDEVVAVLEATLAHIRSLGEPTSEPETPALPTPDQDDGTGDPLDSLLGPAEAQPDAS